MLILLWFLFGFVTPYLAQIFFRWLAVVEDERREKWRLTSNKTTFHWCPTPWIIFLGFISAPLGFISLVAFISFAIIILTVYVLNGEFDHLYDEGGRFTKFLAFMAKPICKK